MIKMVNKMVQDTQPHATKTLRESDKIVQSLMAWRDDLWEKNKFKPIQDTDDPFLIINAILYRGYPKRLTKTELV